MVPDENSMEDPLCNSSFGSMVSLDYVTPDTGFEPKDMELADTNERNLATSSDIYFQNALKDTASFPNVPDVDDDELAEFLAAVVDRTGRRIILVFDQRTCKYSQFSTCDRVYIK